MVVVHKVVDFDQAEDNALANVSVGVRHQRRQHIVEGDQVVCQVLSVLVARLALLLQLTHELQLVLNHAKEGLQPGRLLRPEQRLNRLRNEVRIAGDDKLLEQVFCYLVSDTLVMRSDLWRIRLESSDQNFVA